MKIYLVVEEYFLYGQEDYVLKAFSSKEAAEKFKEERIALPKCYNRLRIDVVDLEEE
jgi:hypothetical protein